MVSSYRNQHTQTPVEGLGYGILPQDSRRLSLIRRATLRSIHSFSSVYYPVPVSPISASLYHSDVLGSGETLIEIPWANETNADLSLSCPPQIEKKATQVDPHIVDWAKPTDSENPQDWSNGKKWRNVALLSTITMISSLESSMFAPGIPQVMDEFHSDSQVLGAFVVSIYILGYVFGPLFMAPLSELFGRLYVYHASDILLTLFTVACAKSTSLNMLIIFRFLAGVAGSASIILGGGSVADMFAPLERGKAMAVLSLGPLLGPVIGPIGGGFLTEAKDWRWVFWLLTILNGAATLAAFAVLRETYSPVLLAAKAQRLRRETGDPDYQSIGTSNLSSTTTSQSFAQAIIRPMKMLLLSPIVFFISFYMSVVYGYLYLLFTTITFVFTEPPYRFTTSLVGLTYLGIGAGMLLGTVAFGFLSDKLVARQSENPKPERRLLPMILATPFIPAGLLLYGWTASSGVHWVVPILGTALVGLGLVGTFMPAMTYLVDCFSLYAASATAANTVMRSVGGALLPLAGTPMREVLGLGWASTLLAIVAAACIPIPWLLQRYGETLRKRYPVHF